jgi:hypothetical protein
MAQLWASGWHVLIASLDSLSKKVMGHENKSVTKHIILKNNFTLTWPINCNFLIYTVYQFSFV